jgi:hypothetical protein
VSVRFDVRNSVDSLYWGSALRQQLECTIAALFWTSFVKGFLHLAFNFVLCFLKVDDKFASTNSPSAETRRRLIRKIPNFVSTFRAKTPIFRFTSHADLRPLTMLLVESDFV